MFKTIFSRFPGIFIEKTTFKEFEQICEQIDNEEENQYNDKKETIDFNIDYWQSEKYVPKHLIGLL